MKSKVIQVVLILFSLGFGIYIIRQIKIESISCSSQYGKCDDHLEKELSQISGSNMFSSRKMVEKVLDSKIYIRNYSIYYNIPDKLEVNILVKKPNY